MPASQLFEYRILSPCEQARLNYAFLSPDQTDAALPDFSFFTQYFDVTQEITLAFFFDKSSQPIGYAHWSSGLVASVSFSVRDFVQLALRVGAYSTLIAHNHPSGDATPSQIDIDMTKTILKTLKPLQITLQDHIIHANDKCFSFKSNGLM